MTNNLSKKATISKGYDKFLTLCYAEKSRAGLKELLDFFLTIEERNVIATRVLLVRELLKDEKTQRQIAKELGISIAKITRGSNMLKALDEAVQQKLLQKLVDEQ